MHLVGGGGRGTTGKQKLGGERGCGEAGKIQQQGHICNDWEARDRCKKLKGNWAPP